MSDGKKFSKTDSNLTPEQRLEEVERKYGVILGRIQAYDQVLSEFANINSDLNVVKQSIEKINKFTSTQFSLIYERIEVLGYKINVHHKSQELLKTRLEDQSTLNKALSDGLSESGEKFHRDIEILKIELGDIKGEHNNVQCLLDNLEKKFTELNKPFIDTQSKLDNLSQDHSFLKSNVQVIHSSLKDQIDQLLSSVQNLPQFNEWATKIYIRICNEISDKQKQIYGELDKRSQQLKDQLASDPYTADSVKKILKSEMDELAMDGKNAYLKATNAAQQIQLLEKKIENINLILKKYELNK